MKRVLTGLLIVLAAAATARGNIDPFQFLQPSYTYDEIVFNPHPEIDIKGADAFKQGTEFWLIYENGVVAKFTDGSSSEYNFFETFLTATGISEVPPSFGMGGTVAISTTTGIYFYDEDGNLMGSRPVNGATVQDISWDSERERLVVITTSEIRALREDGTLEAVRASGGQSIEVINLGEDQGTKIDDLLHKADDFYKLFDNGLGSIELYTTDIPLSAEGTAYTQNGAVVVFPTGWLLYPQFGFHPYILWDDFGPFSPCDFDQDGDCDPTDLDMLTMAGDLVAGIAVGSGNEPFDLNADNLINSADLTLWLTDAATINGFASPYLRGDTDLDHDVDTVDLTTAIINFTGAGGSGKVWTDGDNDGDGDTDTVDLTAAITNFTGASAVTPNVPDLIYDPATGNVTIDADDADMISFSLQAGPFNAADFSDLPAGLTDNIANQIGWTSFNLFTGLTGTADLGAILPAGLDLADLEAALTTASYGLALFGGGGGGTFDLIIPEPASLALFGIVAFMFMRHRANLYRLDAVDVDHCLDGFNSVKPPK